MRPHDTSLSNLIKRNNNNYDLIRLIAALLVIYGHTNAMIPQHLHSGDFVYKLLTFEYSGSLAVKAFFFLSGLVVTNSLLDKRDIQQFLIARTFRIWPALLVVLSISALILGSLYTQLDLKTYLTHKETYAYIIKNALMNIQFELPAVFHTHAEAPLNHRAINGSLWSLPYELACYVFLLAIFILGIHKHKTLCVFIVLLIIADTLSGKQLIFNWRPINPTVDDLGPVFAMGALAALFKDRIPINFKISVALFVIYFLFAKASYNKYIFYVAFFYTALYIFSRPLAIKAKVNFDISYGIYIWGWPTQQVLAHSLPNLGFYTHTFLAIVIASLAATLSWFYIEKPCISYGQALHKKLQAHRSYC